MTSPDPTYPRDLADLNRLLTDSPDVDAALRRVAELAVRSVPSSFAAAVVLADRTGPRTLAASSNDIWTLAEFQYRHREGPGAEAIRFGEPRRVDDTRTEQRWPGFTSHAAAGRVRSALALPLRPAGTASGALTFYADQPHAFDGVSHDMAVLFAAQSRLALSNSDLYYASQSLVQNLHAALETRAVIEQAKGIVMAREQCTPEQAFEVLVGVSQRADKKVRDVAVRVVAEAAGPPSDAP